MDGIVKVHEKIFRFLQNWRSKHEGFTFVLRKSDLKKRLSTGYWFYGNDDYIALSFWTGTDWQRRIPNISFIIKPENGETYLQISTMDSVEKTNLISSLFDPEFQFDNFGDALYLKTTPFAQSIDYLSSLQKFLERDKAKIDEIIRKNKKRFETKQNPKNRIGFIAVEEFNKQLTRVLSKRKLNGNDDLPISISSISIEEFGPIKNIKIDSIEKDVQWIFLTGENGTGKTSILKALAMACANGTLVTGPTTAVGSDYSLGLSLNKYGKNPKYRIRPKQHIRVDDLNLLTTGFVAFGPIRINITENAFVTNVSKADPELMFKRPHLSLFNTASYLIDIGTVYNNRRPLPKRDLELFQDRFHFIVQAITAICPAIVDIRFEKSMKYFEVDKDKEILNDNGTSFKNLASGYKSIIGLISHMMLHLYHQQPHVHDPSELVGIVIIDEIDLHFHPKMQKDLVVALSDIFPRIQFIVSTHSPIPLLGTPPNSVIYTVGRNKNEGVFIEKMSDRVPFGNMLPNSILTSPIFGLTDIIPDNPNPGIPLRTEDSFEDIGFYIKMEDELNKFLTNREQKKLIDLFTKGKNEKSS